MKRFLSLFLVVVMLFAALAMVACGKQEDETTDSTTTATTEATTTTTKETTETTTTTATTEATTTTEPTTEATTTTETTTTATTTTATTETTVTEPTTATSGTTEGVFARFDFGTKTEAAANNLTSHEYLTSHLQYNTGYLWVDYDEDNIIIYATQDYNYSTMKSGSWSAWNASLVNAYALCYEDISADYTFEDPQEIHCGFGTWANYPYSSAMNNWKGYHQYFKIRFVNASANTKISFQWKGTANMSSWFSTAFVATKVTPGKATSAYLNDDANYQIVIADITAAGNLATGGNELTADNGKGPGNNWIWGGDSLYVTGIRFHLLGAYVAGNGRNGCTFATDGSSSDSGVKVEWKKGDATSSAKVAGALDSRGLIKAGNAVKVDYIVFGSTPEQLLEYKSAAEKAYDAKASK